MITIETYTATLQHDKGKVRLQVASMRGKQGAIQQIMAIENCPMQAIIGLKIKGRKIVK
ncbi:hypothetical protein HHL23_13455 [Chryseobacterium sp. RP-3-3]|uniref:Uncharacterized protein n=1 Tax=Chryseobacterium antibioticum TaxID=2728847 RepID=A0A7Y0ANY8_9FLAO|nr:hypothetical protein [Chryseobacterium antibioticum]NML70794.1 hypothetical protein [Chryseobacterium antibioticum]